MSAATLSGLIERRDEICCGKVRDSREKVAGGATPGLLDRTVGERPRASRIVRVLRSDLPAELRGHGKSTIAPADDAIQIGPRTKKLRRTVPRLVAVERAAGVYAAVGY